MGSVGSFFSNLFGGAKSNLKSGQGLLGNIGPKPLNKPTTPTRYSPSPSTARANFTNNFGKPVTKSAVPSNAGATGTGGTNITPPSGNPSFTGAGQTFINNQLAPDDASNKYNTSTGQLNTSYSDYQAPKQPGLEETDPYMKYLSSLFSPEGATKAGNDLTAANTKLAGIQSQEEARSLRGAHDYERLLDESGGLTSGAQASASMSGRRTNAELADLSVQEGAAARSAQVANDTYNRYIDAGKSVYEAKQAAQKAQKEDERYNKEFSYKQGQDKLSQANIDRKFEEDKRQFGQEYALKARQASIDEAKVKPGTIGSGTNDVVSVVDALLGNKQLSRISGSVDKFLGGNFGGAALAKNQFNQLKGMLSLENRQQLKGSGAISDFEFKILSQAATALGRNLSDKAFRAELQKLKDNLSAKALAAISGTTSGSAGAPSANNPLGI